MVKDDGLVFLDGIGPEDSKGFWIEQTNTETCGFQSLHIVAERIDAHVVFLSEAGGLAMGVSDVGLFDGSAKGLRIRHL